MADKNPITGDLLQSRMNSKEFEDNFDRIFRRKEAFKELQESADQYFAEYELHPSTGEVQKRFVDGISKPNGEQFGEDNTNSIEP
jgi:hypothetical protein